MAFLISPLYPIHPLSAVHPPHFSFLCGAGAFNSDLDCGNCPNCSPLPCLFIFWGLQLTFFPIIKWHFQNTIFVITPHLINNFRIFTLSQECFLLSLRPQVIWPQLDFLVFCINFPHKRLFLERVLYRLSAEHTILYPRLFTLGSWCFQTWHHLPISLHL